MMELLPLNQGHQDRAGSVCRKHSLPVCRSELLFVAAHLEFVFS